LNGAFRRFRCSGKASEQIPNKPKWFVVSLALPDASALVLMLVDVSACHGMP